MKREYQELTYNQKRYTVPLYDPQEGCIRISPRSGAADLPSMDEKVITELNEVYSIDKYLEPRPPVQVGKLSPPDQALYSQPSDARNVLDLPIKFPGSDYRLPVEYAQWAPVVQRVADVEWAINRRCHDEYYCYFSLRRSHVEKGGQGHYAPCHVDGFQGARWNPKVRHNHTYTIEDRLPTMYFLQPFDLRPLDLARHNVFWEMNRQVAGSNAKYGWNAYDDYTIQLMDAYCVHIAIDAPQDCFRTWVRLSFEVRIFDRLGNGRNPFFDYDWAMVPRDIEQLDLVAFDPSCDPSLRVFPWQALDGSPNPKGVHTRPNLRPLG